MGSFRDLSGQRFGKLVAVKRNGKTRLGMIKWDCNCDCGSVCNVSMGCLTSGHTRSCGCYKSEALSRHFRKRSTKDSKAHRDMRVYIKGANSRGLLFELSFDDFVRISSADCVYCGEHPMSRKDRILGKVVDSGRFANGLDRVDNSIGYTVSNVVPCCKKCNRAKDTMSVMEFKRLIKNQYTKLFNGDVNFSIVEMATSQEARDSFIRKAA